MTVLSPVDFGLPSKFTSWRESQLEAVNSTVDSRQRFVCICAPTGWGKSLYYMATAAMSGLRTVVLTSTKGLQDQLLKDFESISVDIRGMQNYPCTMAAEFGFPAYTRVADGPCHSGARCHLRSVGCGYFDDYRQAQTADIVVTNYQCWMYDRHKGKGSLQEHRPVEMLVLDEAHESMTELASYLAVELERKHCLSMGLTWPVSGYTQDQWKQWAGYWIGILEAQREELEEEIRDSSGTHDHAMHGMMHQIKEIKALSQKLERVGGMQGEWVIEEVEPRDGSMKGVKCDPLWPREYAESALFRGVGKVVLVSATARPKTAHLLGISDSSLAFEEYPSSFPVERRPVIHVPTVRVNRHTEQSDSHMMWWLRRIDNLIGQRADRKGVLHTVSYRRARFVRDNSRYRDRMIVHGSDDRAQAIESFRRAGPGAVLVSPSVDTGYDFPMEEAEYQIIGKLPFPDTRGAVMKARCGEDKDYSAYVTAQTLQQMTGRVMRSQEDYGESIIIDDNVTWFIPKYKRFFNQWWLSSYQTQRSGLPVPLPKL